MDNHKDDFGWVRIAVKGLKILLALMIIAYVWHFSGDVFQVIRTINWDDVDATIVSCNVIDTGKFRKLSSRSGTATLKVYERQLKLSYSDQGVNVTKDIKEEYLGNIDQNPNRYFPFKRQDEISTARELIRKVDDERKETKEIQEKVYKYADEINKLNKKNGIEEVKRPKFNNPGSNSDSLKKIFSSEEECGSKFQSDTVVQLKINPRNRAEVVRKPDYRNTFLSLAALLFVCFLAFTWIPSWFRGEK